MIEVRNLSFNYHRGGQVLKNLSVVLAPGEVVNILGPNGCGKTTFLKIILGLLPIAPATVFINGQPLEQFKRHQLAHLLAYVPQAHNGVFHYTVREMVLMGRTNAGPWHHFSAEDEKKTQAVLKRIHLNALADRSYLEISGGEKQLVLIARALVQDSSFLIMDEPVNGLDYGNQFRLLNIIRELADTGLAIVLTTHHPEQAIFLGGRALLIKNGHLVADGPTDRIITADAVTRLYDLPPALLDQARHFAY